MVKNLILRIIASNRFALSKLQSYKLKDSNQLLTECLRRKKLNIFDYKTISQPLTVGQMYINGDANLYGLGYTFSRYIEADWDPRITFEHGFIYSSMVQPYLFKSPLVKSVITFSDYRSEVLKKKGIFSIKVGPYIHYAKNLLDDEYNKLKSQLGKVLLVFPSHSIASLAKEFDITLFINHIQSIRDNFDTVIICLYWKDIQLGRSKLYEEMGYKVVTAGHINDLFFLDRLRSIINLSDMTLSNDIGTHLSYCLYLGRPHQIFDQSISHRSLGDSVQEKLMYKAEINARNKNEWSEYYDIKYELTRIFGKFHCTIQDDQLEYASKLFGFNEVMSKDLLISKLG